MEDDMVMGEGFRSRVMEFADRVLSTVLRDPKRSRHAEMHDKHVAGRKIGKEIFCAAAKASDRLVGQACSEVLWERETQVGASRLDLPEAHALHDGCKAPSHGLNFG
jgi:hypothetical protein